MKRKWTISLLIVVLASTNLAAQQIIQKTVTLFLAEEVHIEQHPTRHNGDQYYGGSEAIGKEQLDTTAVFRSFYVFDITQIANANNVSIQSVTLYYATDRSGYTFKITGPSSINNFIASGANFTAIKNANTKASGLVYTSSSVTNSNLKNYMSDQLSTDKLILGTMSEDESTIGSYASFTTFYLEVTYTYQSYTVTARNDFDELSYGGQIGVGVDTTVVSQTSPYTFQAINGDQIHLAAYDHQNADNYEWVFNNTEAPDNKSEWDIEKKGNINRISYNQTTTYTTDNDQNAIISDVQKKLCNVYQNYQTEFGTGSSTNLGKVVEKNSITISAQSTRIQNGDTLTFVGWKNIDSGSNPASVTLTDNTTYTALYKGHQLSNDASAYNSNQRHYIQSENSWTHMVYVSMGHVWYERKAPGGSWQLVPQGGTANPTYIDDYTGKSPAIDFAKNFPGYPGLIGIVYQEGSIIYLKTWYYDTGNGQYYNWQARQITTGESSSYHLRPNIAWGPDNYVMVVWESPSGLKYVQIDMSPDHPRQSYSGTIPGTDGNSVNVAISDIKTTMGGYDIVWEQNGSGGSDAIKYIYVYDESTTAWPSSPMTISNSGYPYNRGLSIISLPVIGPRVAWLEANQVNPDPFNVHVAFCDPYGSTISTYDYHDTSVSLNKVDDNSNFYLVWSQHFDDPMWTDHNFVVSGDNLSTWYFANTKGKYVQINNGSGSSQMRLSSYYTDSNPYHFVESNPVGGTQSPTKMAAGNAGTTVSSPTIYTGRGALIGNEGAAIAYILSHIKNGGQQVRFVQVSDTLRFHTLAQLNKELITKPFTLQKGQKLGYEEEVEYGDSAAAARLLSKGSVVRYTVDLVDASSGQVLENVQNRTFNSTLRPVRVTGADSISADAFAGRTVQLRITLSTNIKNPDEMRLVKVFRMEEQQKQGIAKEMTPEALDNITQFELNQNYPNPFNPTTNITYQVPKQSRVTLKVYNVLGQLVATLVNGVRAKGQYTVTFNGSSLASGVYIYRLTAGSFTQTRQFMLIK